MGRCATSSLGGDRLVVVPDAASSLESSPGVPATGVPSTRSSRDRRSPAATRHDGLVAQSGSEHPVVSRKVEGSNPFGTAHASVAKLVNAPGSGPGGHPALQVRLLSLAPCGCSSVGQSVSLPTRRSSVRSRSATLRFRLPGGDPESRLQGVAQPGRAPAIKSAVAGSNPVPHTALNTCLVEVRRFSVQDAMPATAKSD